MKANVIVQVRDRSAPGCVWLQMGLWGFCTEDSIPGDPENLRWIQRLRTSRQGRPWGTISTPLISERGETEDREGKGLYISHSKLEMLPDTQSSPALGQMRHAVPHGGSILWEDKTAFCKFRYFLFLFKVDYPQVSSFLGFSVFSPTELEIYPNVSTHLSGSTLLHIQV